MVQFCRVNQINYIELNPLEAKFKTSSLRSWKTDKSDAHKLAQLAPKFKSIDCQQSYSDIFFELRERARFHLEMENEQNRLKVEIVESLHQTFPQLEKLFKNCYSIIALNIAKQFPHPEYVYQQELETLVTSIFNSTDKGLSIKKAENYAEKLVELAHESYPNVAKHSFLVQKNKTINSTIKTSIQ